MSTYTEYIPIYSSLLVLSKTCIHTYICTVLSSTGTSQGCGVCGGGGEVGQGRTGQDRVHTEGGEQGAEKWTRVRFQRRGGGGEGCEIFLCAS